VRPSLQPQGDNLEAGINDTASLTATEEETHILQTQTAPTDEAWPRHRNPKSDKVPNSPTPGTSSKQHVETLIENLGNCKRTRGSDDEHLSDNPEAGSIDEFWQSQRNATSNTVPNSPAPGSSSKQQVETLLEPNEVAHSPETDTSSRQQAHAFPESQEHPKIKRESRKETDAALLGVIDTMTNTITSRPDTSKCIQVGSNTFVVRTQPETPSSHHVEESIVFYDSFTKPKRRPGHGTRKRMKLHPS
jgi:hypothetical protein